MAYVTPPSRATGDIVTSSIWNQDIVNNQLAGPNEICTAQGDMIYATAAETLARLAKGTAYQTLRMNSGATAPEWAARGGIVLDSTTSWTAANKSDATFADLITLSITPLVTSIVFLWFHHKMGKAAAGGGQYKARIGIEGAFSMSHDVLDTHADSGTGHWEPMDLIGYHSGITAGAKTCEVEWASSDTTTITSYDRMLLALAIPQ